MRAASSSASHSARSAVWSFSASKSVACGWFSAAAAVAAEVEHVLLTARALLDASAADPDSVWRGAPAFLEVRTLVMSNWGPSDANRDSTVVGVVRGILAGDTLWSTVDGLAPVLAPALNPAATETLADRARSL